MPIAYSSLNRPSCEHGVSDSEYPIRVAPTQVSKAINFDMAVDGKLESRGGSFYLTTTTVGATAKVQAIHDFVQRKADGSITHTTIIKAGTVVYKFNASTGVFDQVRTGLSESKPSIVNFISNAGSTPEDREVIIYADGTNLGMYNGTTWTDIASNFTAGGGTDIPRYLFAKHNFLWATGDDSNPDKVFFSPLLAPDTNWGSNDWVRIAGGLEKVIGLNEVYDHLFVAGQNSMHIITGKTSSDFSPIQVSGEVGCSSHWSIVPVESDIFWANETGIHVGRLRAAEDDALDTELVSTNMQVTFNNISAGTHGEIEGVYFSPKKQIYWTIQDADDGASDPDRILIYSAARSRPHPYPPQHGADTRFVWAGYHRGLTYCSIGVVKDSNELPLLYVGGADGKVLQLYSGFKDKRDSSAVDPDKTAVSYEIRSREETFGGIARTIRLVNFFPTLSQRQNGSCTVQFVVNRTLLKPDDARAITFRGNIPYWTEGADETITTKWSSTIWEEKPVLSAKVKAGYLAHSVIFRIQNDGSRDKDEISYVGYDMDFQRLRRVRGRDA